MAIDASNRENDRFGYSVYAVVAFAPEGLTRKVDALRRGIAMERVAIPAHVTVKGTFCDIDSLDGLRSLIGDIAAGTPPVEMRFEAPDPVRFEETFGVLEIRPKQLLSGLNEALSRAIDPISTNAYFDGPFWPHLTLCQECSAAQIEQAKQLAAKLEPGTGFTCGAIDLMGRVGTAYGGRWESIELFRLRG